MYQRIKTFLSTLALLAFTLPVVAQSERGAITGRITDNTGSILPDATITLRNEVERTDSLLRAVGQRDPIWFRPPYGYKLLGLPRFLERTRRTTVMWSIEPDSYADVAETPEGIVRHVLDRVRPGSIILLHPWYPIRRTSRAAIGPLVDSLHARGYRVETVGALIAASRAAGARR